MYKAVAIFEYNFGLYEEKKFALKTKQYVLG